MTDTTVFNPEAHVAAVLAREQAERQRLHTAAGRSGSPETIPATVEGNCLRLTLPDSRDIRCIARWQPVTMDVWECELRLLRTPTGPRAVSYTVNLVQQQDEFQRIIQALGEQRPLASNLQGLRNNPWLVLLTLMARRM